LTEREWPHKLPLEIEVRENARRGGKTREGEGEGGSFGKQKLEPSLGGEKRVPERFVKKKEEDVLGEGRETCEL